jgi:hypothetical protein
MIRILNIHGRLLKGVTMKKIISALIATVALITSPALSQAGFSVTVSDTHGNSHVFNTEGGSLSGYHSFTYANGSILRFAIEASTNSPGVGGVGQVTNQTISFLRGGTGTLGAQSITIVANSTGFDLNASGGTVTTNFSSGVLMGSAYGTTNINGVAVAGSGLNLSGSLQDRTSTVETTFGSTPFSIGNTMQINLNPRGMSNTSLAMVNIQSTVEGTVLTAPAPPALILAALGIPALGFVRRWTRKAKLNSEMVIAA